MLSQLKILLTLKTQIIHKNHPKSFYAIESALKWRRYKAHIALSPEYFHKEQGSWSSQRGSEGYKPD